MKVLGVVGSPRKGGNTDVLINTALEGAESKDIITEKIYLKDLNINECDREVADKLEVMEKAYELGKKIRDIWKN